ncbi:hypothetical protein Dda_6365 [Drechslerella dactyloides]|uniref:F-box domain-containing protein n=1 Tax=Drechslerella dactyloides TaxID=74499 RepID=A0AAD6NHC4_DREDA|nr:hypothetical protein Dda_6365 [Drechslerella dactyloides]
MPIKLEILLRTHPAFKMDLPILLPSKSAIQELSHLFLRPGPDIYDLLRIPLYATSPPPISTPLYSLPQNTIDLIFSNLSDFDAICFSLSSRHLFNAGIWRLKWIVYTRIPGASAGRSFHETTYGSCSSTTPSNGATPFSKRRVVARSAVDAEPWTDPAIRPELRHFRRRILASILHSQYYPPLIHRIVKFACTPPGMFLSSSSHTRRRRPQRFGTKDCRNSTRMYTRWFVIRNLDRREYISPDTASMRYLFRLLRSIARRNGSTTYSLGETAVYALWVAAKSRWAGGRFDIVEALGWEGWHDVSDQVVQEYIAARQELR